jgi:adenylate cyclase
MADPVEDDAHDSRTRRARRRVAEVAARLDSNPRLVTLAKVLREFLPGDSEFGDPLSTGGKEQAQLVGRRLSAVTAHRPGVLREAGFGALQVWQALSEAQGRGRGDQELAIVFTDLVEFSDWALEAGDDLALQLLRDVGEAIEPPVEQNGGEVVKRLGDGMMAVFEDTGTAFDALVEGRQRLTEVDCEGYRPHIRAGVHVGRPRRIGGDYIGIDVNIAARVAEEAGAEEILVTVPAIDRLRERQVDMAGERRIAVKGVPRDLVACALSPA